MAKNQPNETWWAQVNDLETKYYAISFSFFTKKVFPEIIPGENFGDEFQSKTITKIKMDKTIFILFKKCPANQNLCKLGPQIWFFHSSSPWKTSGYEFRN